jgi:hypothetical protein
MAKTKLSSTRNKHRQPNHHPANLPLPLPLALNLSLLFLLLLLYLLLHHPSSYNNKQQGGVPNYYSHHSSRFKILSQIHILKTEP